MRAAGRMATASEIPGDSRNWQACRRRRGCVSPSSPRGSRRTFRSAPPIQIETDTPNRSIRPRCKLNAALERLEFSQGEYFVARETVSRERGSVFEPSDRRRRPARQRWGITAVRGPPIHCGIAIPQQIARRRRARNDGELRAVGIDLSSQAAGRYRHPVLFRHVLFGFLERRGREYRGSDSRRTWPRLRRGLPRDGYH